MKHHTQSRRNMRRSHLALEVTELVKCPKCGTMIKPHRVCKNCGFYKGTEVKKIETALDRKNKQTKKATRKAEK